MVAVPSLKITIYSIPRTILIGWTWSDTNSHSLMKLRLLRLLLSSRLLTKELGRDENFSDSKRKTLSKAKSYLSFKNQLRTLGKNDCQSHLCILYQISSMVISGKESACHCRRHKGHGFNSWVRKCPGVGNGQPLQYSCLENFMDRIACWTTV